MYCPRERETTRFESAYAKSYFNLASSSASAVATPKQQKIMTTSYLNYKNPLFGNKRGYWDFTQAPDVVLQVEEKEVFVHRSILVNASPVFRVMLESDHFVEKNLSKISLPHKKAVHIQQLLNFIYPFGHQITEQTDLESLLCLSREYQMDGVKSLCENYLLRRIPSIDELIIAQEYDLPNLKEKSLKQLSEKALSGLQEHPRFKEIEDSIRLRILEQQLKRLQVYCKKVSQISYATDMRFMPITTHIHCKHKPKNCSNYHFMCQLCKASALKGYIKDESWKLGLNLNKTNTKY